MNRVMNHLRMILWLKEATEMGWNRDRRQKNPTCQFPSVCRVILVSSRCIDNDNCDEVLNMTSLNGFGTKDSQERGKTCRSKQVDCHAIESQLFDVK